MIGLCGRHNASRVLAVARIRHKIATQRDELVVKHKDGVRQKLHGDCRVLAVARIRHKIATQHDELVVKHKDGVRQKLHGSNRVLGLAPMTDITWHDLPVHRKSV